MFRSWEAFKPAWIEALRSGEYRQGYGSLLAEGRRFDRFCCLGVAANILIENGHALEWKDGRLFNTRGVGSGSRLCGLAPEWLADKLRGSVRCDLIDLEDELIRMNDNGTSFKKIADFIEKEM